VVRFILSFFGSIFSTITLGIAMIALTIGAVFWIYGRDLPSHESLAQYQPPTISRIYHHCQQLACFALAAPEQQSDAQV